MGIKAAEPNPTTATPLDSLPRPLVAVLSSGFFGFFAHAGFLQGLQDLGVQPDAYAGASSGALVAAFAAGGMSPAEMLSQFRTLRKEEFWDPPRGMSLLRHGLRTFRGRSGWLEGRAMQELLERRLPAATFEDCARPCLMVALDITSNRRVVFDSGPLATPVRASGAVPGMFSAVEMNGALLVDGGLIDKAPLKAALDRLGAASMIVHLLPSTSLGKPLGGLLNRPLAPLRIQSRSVDAARHQSYLDQLEAVRGRGVVLRQVICPMAHRPGPGSLSKGQESFNEAKMATVAELGA